MNREFFLSRKKYFHVDEIIHRLMSIRFKRRLVGNLEGTHADGSAVSSSSSSSHSSTSWFGGGAAVQADGEDDNEPVRFKKTRKRLGLLTAIFLNPKQSAKQAAKMLHLRRQSSKEQVDG